MEKEQRILELKSEIFDIIRQMEILGNQRIAKLKELDALEKET